MSDTTHVDDGGPVHPEPTRFLLDGRPATIAHGYDHPGMTLRDHYAGQALAALIPLEGGPSFGTEAKPYDPWPWFAKEAWRAADAMIAARNVKPAAAETTK